MGSQTPFLKFPFPVSSDFIADGAVDMEQLAGSVEEVMVVPSNSLAMGAAWNAYPIGMSMMQVTNASDWISSGVVLSIRRQGGDQTHQYWSGTSVANPQVAFRYGSSGGWSRWVVLGSEGSPQEMSAATATITVAANAYKTTKVTLPAGRFTNTPRIFLQYNGSVPHALEYSTDNRTPTSFSIITWANTGGWAAAFQWVAIRMTTDLADPMMAPMASPMMAFAAAGEEEPSDPEPEAVQVTEVTCRTDGCFNYGQPIDVGDLSGVDEVLCGSCNQPITATEEG